MCTPLAAVAIGAAQTASSIIGQRQQAQMQAQAQATASSQERQRYLAEVSAMRTQQQQEMVARAQRIQEASKRAMEAKARATVAAGESGLSVQALLGDFSRQEAQYSFSEQQQAEMTDVNRQIQLQEAGIGFSRNMLRINRPIEQPDYIGSVFGGIQTGLSNYSVMKNAGLI